MKVKKQKVSPRQKMINLMYVLLMAMLAMNVSSDVLNGFTLVDESLTRSTENAGVQNNMLYSSLGEMMEKNPEKVREWFERADSVKAKSERLYLLADQLKEMIAKEADGKDADYHNLQHREDLEAATFVMLTSRNGEKLYNAIIDYRKFMAGLVDIQSQKEMIANCLSTDIPENNNTLNKNWQEYHFETMPAIAAITLLTKISNNLVMTFT